MVFRTILRLLVAASTTLVLASGQQDRATITGTISDSSGAAASGIAVTVASLATNRPYE